jgi:hypothetical protein
MEERMVMEVFMESLMKKDDREITQCSIPKRDSDKIRDYREKIADDAYLEHAISKIATDLSHYLTK